MLVVWVFKYVEGWIRNLLVLIILEGKLDKYDCVFVCLKVGGLDWGDWMVGLGFVVFWFGKWYDWCGNLD